MDPQAANSSNEDSRHAQVIHIFQAQTEANNTGLEVRSSCSGFLSRARRTMQGIRNIEHMLIAMLGYTLQHAGALTHVWRRLQENVALRRTTGPCSSNLILVFVQHRHSNKIWPPTRVEGGREGERERERENNKNIPRCALAREMNLSGLGADSPDAVSFRPGHV